MYFEVNSLKTYCSNGSGKLDPSQKSVVFIHGAGFDHTMFVLASRYFARQNYNVYAIDLPAHGNSSGDPLDSIKMMSDWLYIANFVKSLLKGMKKPNGDHCFAIVLSCGCNKDFLHWAFRLSY